MNEDVLKEEIAILESNNRTMQEEMARTWEKYDKIINNWNELKEWLEETSVEWEKWYANDLSNHDKNYYREEYIVTKHNIKSFQNKMQEIESRK